MIDSKFHLQIIGNTEKEKKKKIREEIWSIKNTK